MLEAQCIYFSAKFSLFKESGPFRFEKGWGLFRMEKCVKNKTNIFSYGEMLVGWVSVLVVGWLVLAMQKKKTTM